MQLKRRRHLRGTTIAELAVATLLAGTFFGSMYEVNAVCLRYINASKENVAAIECVGDRIEKLRSLSFNDLTSTSAMLATAPGASVVLVNPPNSSELAKRVTEQVTITDYQDPTRSVIYTRAPGASVTPAVTTNGSFAAAPKTTVVRVKVRDTWTMTMSGRSRVEESETIVSDGVKK